MKKAGAHCCKGVGAKLESEADFRGGWVRLKEQANCQRTRQGRGKKGQLFNAKSCQDASRSATDLQWPEKASWVSGVFISISKSCLGNGVGGNGGTQ